MKRIFSTLLLILAMGIPGYARLLPGQTQLSGTYWVRWTYDKDENRFGLERGYFRLEHQFKKKMKFRFTVDLHSTSSSKYHYGAALRLKDAYLQVKDFIGKGIDLKIGLQKNYFGMVQDWEYLPIVEAFEDQEKLVSSRDYGISIGGKLPGKVGKWRLEITNGEYYKKNHEDLNNVPALIVDMRLKPWKPLTLAASFLTTKDGFGTEQAPYVRRNIYTVWGKVALSPVEISLQYLGAEKLEKKQGGFRVYPVINLSQKLQLFAVYDYFDRDLEAEGFAHNRYVVGLNYYIKRKGEKMIIGLQGAFLREDYENAGSTNKVIIQLTIQPKTNPF